MSVRREAPPYEPIPPDAWHQPLFPDAPADARVRLRQRWQAPLPDGRAPGGRRRPGKRLPYRDCEISDFGPGVTFAQIHERWGGGWYYARLWIKQFPPHKGASSRYFMLEGSIDLDNWPLEVAEPVGPQVVQAVPPPRPVAFTPPSQEDDELEELPVVAETAERVRRAMPSGAPVQMTETVPRERMYDAALMNLLNQAQSMQTATAGLIMQMVESLGKTREQAPRLGELAEILKALQPAAPAPARDPLDMAMKLRELFMPAVKATSPISQLKELMELREMLTNDEPKESDGMLGVVKHFAPLLMEAINAARQQQATPALPPPPEASPTFLDLLAPAVPSLAQAAGDRVPPADVAVHLARQIPEGMAEEVRAALRGPLAEQACARYPILASHRGWVTQLVVELAGVLNAAPSPPSPGPGL